MHTIIILASVLLPLIGVIRMESGAFGNSIGMYGHPNGASIVYAMYAVVLLGSYFALRVGTAAVLVIPPRTGSNFDIYAKSVVSG